MKTFMHRYGTPLTAGLFAISAISGVALFFHWAPRTFHAMHEWLSVALLAPFALHLTKNWRPLLGYLKRRTLLVPLLLSLVVAVPFAVMAGKGGRARNRAFQAVGLMTQASLDDLAPVFHATPGALLKQLQARGYKARSTQQSPAAIAQASGAEAQDVLATLIPADGGRTARRD